MILKEKLHTVKNLKESIKFFHKFYLQDSQSKFLIIGRDYGVKKELVKLIDFLNLIDNVEIIDYMDIEKIRQIAHNYSFFIQLSKYEGMAMSVAESMQLGLIPLRNIHGYTFLPEEVLQE